jgi:hypothetical protein
MGLELLFPLREPSPGSLLLSALSGKLPRFATELWQQSGCLSLSVRRCLPVRLGSLFPVGPWPAVGLVRLFLW